METKTCSICDEVKSLEEYNFTVKNSKNKGEYIYYFPYCRDCNRKKTLKNWYENKEKRIENSKKWKQDNRQRYLDYLSDYHKENREQERQYMNEWQKNNPDKIKGYNQYREMNKKHEISNDEWESCKNYFNYRCAYCGLAIEDHYIQFKGEIILGDFHKDHLDHDGEHDLSNCIPSCKNCNTSKGQHLLEDWYIERNEYFKYERILKIYDWLYDDYIKYLNNHQLK